MSRLCTALLFAFLSLPAHSESDCVLPSEVRSVLEGFLASRENYAYNGTLLLEQGNQRQFIAAASQPGAMVSIRRMNAPSPARATSFALPLPRGGIEVCELGLSYRIAVENGATVAGRATWRLTVQPRDTMRFGYLMDLDRASGLPLRSVTIAPDGQWMERYEFATIDVAPAEPSTLPETVEVDEQGPRFALAALPPGFSVMGKSVSPDQLVVTDGLASASVFIEPIPDGLAAGEGTLRHGSTVTYTRGVRDAGSEYLVTVIGEVPVTTARLLATAVRAGIGG